MKETSFAKSVKTGGNQREVYEKKFLDMRRMEHLLSFFFLLHFYHEEVPSGIFFEREQDCFVRNQISLKGQVHGSAHAHFSKCCFSAGKCCFVYANKYDHLVKKTAQYKFLIL